MESIFRVIVKPINPKKVDDPREESKKEPEPSKINLVSMVNEPSKTPEEEKQKSTAKENLFVYAKNVETLEDYSVRTYLDEKYLPHLQDWVHRKKYKVKVKEDDEGNAYEINLNVEIFDFVLRKMKKKEDKLLEEELKLLRNTNMKIKKELKLFYFYFFGFWNEKMRSKVDTIKSCQEDNTSEFKPNAGSMEEVFKRMKVTGHEIENSEGNKMYCLGLDEKLSDCKDLEKTNKVLNHFNGKSKQKDIIVWGKGLNHGIAHINNETSDTMTINDKTIYLHELDMKVHSKNTYTLCVPKLPHC